jgi:hypothetical protein
MEKKLRVKWNNVILLLFIIMVILIGALFLLNNETENNEVVESISKSKYKVLAICSTSKTKSYMSYKAITAKASNQYIYIQEYMTVNEKGLLVDDDGFIGVALGSYFGGIGSKYKITLDTGNIIYIVKIEAKDDDHTNNGCDQKWDGSVIEFVIDTEIAGEYYGVESNGFVAHGNFNNIEEFNGNITRIEVIN